MDDAARRSILRAVGIAALAGLGALPTALLLILAALIGRRLDATLGTHPVFVLTLLCLAAPLSIWAVLWLARLAARAAARINADDYASLAAAAPAASSTRLEEDDLENE